MQAFHKLRDVVPADSATQEGKPLRTLAVMVMESLPPSIPTPSCSRQSLIAAQAWYMRAPSTLFPAAGP
jgi:hypothetical protein